MRTVIVAAITSALVSQIFTLVVAAPMRADEKVVPVAVATPTPTPTLAQTLGPIEQVHPVLVGIASTYGPGYDGLLAVPIRSWRGSRVRVCWEGNCVTGRVNDLGPTVKGRVVDLDLKRFEKLCKCSWRVGLLNNVTVTLLDV